METGGVTEDTAAFLARMRQLVHAGKEVSFNEPIPVSPQDMKKLYSLCADPVVIERYRVGCDFLLYWVECAEATIQRNIKAALFQ